MTLVPSPLLRLSGNSMRIVCIAIFSFLLSVSYAQVVIEDEDDNKDDAPKTIIIDNPYQHLDSQKTERKAIYNIAFILPINAQRISPGDGKERPATMPLESREVLGFWEGANIAFAKIKKMNTKFNFHIWDNQKNDSITKTILSDLKYYNIDAIVAPFHTKEALLVSNYSKANKIPMFLAQNPSDVPAKSNPYAFKFHIPKNKMLYDYYRKIQQDISYNGAQIYYVYDGQSKAERKTANFLKYMAEKDGSQRLKFVEYSASTSFGALLDTNSQNVLMISYYKTAQVVEILDKLLALKSDKIAVFGHNLWSNNAKLSLDKLSRLNARVYTDYYLKNNYGLVEDIKNNYASMTSDNTVSDVFLGYDVAMYIANIFDKYGQNFPLQLDQYKYYGAVSNIHMKPMYDTDRRISYFENTSKFLLKATREEWVQEE